MNNKPAKISLEDINDVVNCIREINTYIGKSVNLREVADKYRIKNRNTFVKHLIEVSKCFNAGAGRPTIVRNKISEEPIFARALLTNVKKLAKRKNSTTKQTSKSKTVSIPKEVVRSFDCLDIVNELNIISYEDTTLIIRLGGYEVICIRKSL